MYEYYAGIGARTTPPDILRVMYMIGHFLAHNYNCVCRTGAARGADQAFAQGANDAGGKVQLFLPWATFEHQWVKSLNNPEITVLDPVRHYTAMESVNKFHPAPEQLTNAARLLHARNFLIIGIAEKVLCWTRDGKEVGGTGQALRMVNSSIVKNLGNPEHLQQIKEVLASQGYSV